MVAHPRIVHSHQASSSQFDYADIFEDSQFVSWQGAKYLGPVLIHPLTVLISLARDGDILVVELAKQIGEDSTFLAASAAIIDKHRRWGREVRSRSPRPVSRPSWLTSSTDSARASAVRILVRCEVDNAGSHLLAWKPQLGARRYRLPIPGISRPVAGRSAGPFTW